MTDKKIIPNFSTATQKCFSRYYTALGDFLFSTRTKKSADEAELFKIKIEIKQIKWN
jgi:hypothetical protein